MFTQCAKCETIFRLSAEVLRAAGGQVRCGRCGEVFNALARLAEDASAFSAGESELEMETRADRILNSGAVQDASRSAAAEDAREAGEIARLRLLDSSEEAPSADVPGREAIASRPERRQARPSAESKPPAPSEPSAGPAEEAVAASEAADESTDDGSLEFTLPPGELDRVFVEPKTRDRQYIPGLMSAPAAAAAQAPGASADSAGSRPNGVQPSGLRPSGVEVSDEVRREMLAGLEEVPLPEISTPPRPPLPFALWLTAAIVLSLTLLGQVIHEDRLWVATHAPLRETLRGAYEALGVALPSPANLSAYELRQWGVTGDPAANGTLRVRASILNTAAQMQPYPLLRVTLADRFGKSIGTRDFEPAEYMGKPTVRMLSPGERADATLEILDPGKDAEGFEIDVCLRGIDQKISCAADAAAQARQ